MSENIKPIVPNQLPDQSTSQVTVEQMLQKMNMDFNLLRIRQALFELKREKYNFLKEVSASGKETEIGEQLVTLLDEIIQFPTN